MPASPYRSEAWCRAAARRGQPAARATLAFRAAIELHGDPSPLWCAAREGDAEAAALLGELALRDRVPRERTTELCSFLACAASDARAERVRGSLLARDGDNDGALRAWLEAARAGDLEAVRLVAVARERAGEALDAASWYERVVARAEGRNVAPLVGPQPDLAWRVTAAHAALGRLYGTAERRFRPLAARHLRRAQDRTLLYRILFGLEVAPVQGSDPRDELIERAHMGDPEAAFHAAELAGDPMSEEVQRLFRQAAAAGHTEAPYWIAESHRLAEPPDLKAALRWYRTAADLGDFRAAFRLGELYADGCGVERDRDTAKRWFATCADGGCVFDEHIHLAASRLGELQLEDGQPQVALQWFLRASLVNYRPEPFVRLATMYESGMGCLKDDEIAAEWYRLVWSAWRLPLAAEALAAMYRTGRGVSRSDEESDWWASKVPR